MATLRADVAALVGDDAGADALTLHLLAGASVVAASPATRCGRPAGRLSLRTTRRGIRLRCPGPMADGVRDRRAALTPNPSPARGRGEHDGGLFGRGHRKRCPYGCHARPARRQSRSRGPTYLDKQKVIRSTTRPPASRQPGGRRVRLCGCGGVTLLEGTCMKNGRSVRSVGALAVWLLLAGPDWTGRKRGSGHERLGAGGRGARRRRAAGGVPRGRGGRWPLRDRPRRTAPVARLAIASTFKLYVLAELARQVQAGAAAWDEEIADRRWSPQHAVGQHRLRTRRHPPYPPGSGAADDPRQRQHRDRPPDRPPRPGARGGGPGHSSATANPRSTSRCS